jgi:hypothetical protein
VSVVPEYEEKEFVCICEGKRAVVGITVFDEPRLDALVAGLLQGGRDTDTCDARTFMKEVVKTRVFEKLSLENVQSSRT